MGIIFCSLILVVTSRDYVLTMLYCLLDNAELRHFESLNFGSPEPDPSLQKQFEMLVYSFAYNILSSQ